MVSEYDDDLSAGDSKITFADKAKFKDNYCDVRRRFALPVAGTPGQSRTFIVVSIKGTRNRLKGKATACRSSRLTTCPSVNICALVLVLRSRATHVLGRPPHRFRAASRVDRTIITALSLARPLPQLLVRHAVVEFVSRRR